jgi:lactate permease
MWQQVYNPFGNIWLSTLVASIPIVVMLISIGILHLKAHIAAGLALLSALLIAIIVFGMPGEMAIKASLLGGLIGVLPIGWIVLNVIFLQQLTEKNGSFKILQNSIASITEDRRLQLLLIAFAFGAFLEGAAGFGTPVAVTAAILIGLGFSPLAASVLSLIANTAPVAFGALGTPIITLANVHGYDVMAISAMVGRQLPIFSLIIPFWLIWAFAGRAGMMQVWPALLVTGISFSVPQFLVSNYIGPELVDVIAAMSSMASLIIFLKFWKPKEIWKSASLKGYIESKNKKVVIEKKIIYQNSEVISAWMPWLILTISVFIWGLPFVKDYLNNLFAPRFPIYGLHQLVAKVAPAVSLPTNEDAIYTFNFLSATGTGILLASIISGFVMKYNPWSLIKNYVYTFWLIRYSLITIILMLGLGTLTRYSGLDTTLGIAFASTGILYPFFGTLMGWMGVALTGSDTASNVLFGGMQKVAAEQIGLSPNLMGAANSSGGVMGKMIDAQSIVVASTATRWFNHEGDILRYVFFHSIALACLVGIFVTMQAYIWPFTLMVVN